MKEKTPGINLPSKTALLSALALCVLLFLIIQCGQYARQNRDLTAEAEELSAALAEREQTIADKERILANKEQLLDDQTQKTENLQEQLAEAASIEEYETTTGFLKKGGVYLIDTASQLWDLKWRILKELEIEPGVSAATATYRLRNDLKLDSYTNICLGTEENPNRKSENKQPHEPPLYSERRLRVRRYGRTSAGLFRLPYKCESGCMGSGCTGNSQGIAKILGTE